MVEQTRKIILTSSTIELMNRTSENERKCDPQSNSLESVYFTKNILKTTKKGQVKVYLVINLI